MFGYADRHVSTGSGHVDIPTLLKTCAESLIFERDLILFLGKALVTEDMWHTSGAVLVLPSSNGNLMSITENRVEWLFETITAFPPSEPGNPTIQDAWLVVLDGLTAFDPISRGSDHGLRHDALKIWRDFGTLLCYDEHGLRRDRVPNLMCPLQGDSPFDPLRGDGYTDNRLTKGFPVGPHVPSRKSPCNSLHGKGSVDLGFLKLAGIFGSHRAATGLTAG